MRRALFGIVAAAAILLGIPGALASVDRSTLSADVARSAIVYQVDQTGTVDPLTARLVERGVANAERDGAAALLVRIDTPGGLDSSMRRIVQAIQRSNVPVVCWVGPPGARAASAGAFILIGCPVAAMAPGTNVGAAHPVGFSGEVLGEKITNDAAAYIRSLAERWGRNADWAEKAVRESVSVPAQEAVRIKVADVLASSRSALFAEIAGRAIRVAAGDPVPFPTRVDRVVTVKHTAGEALLHNLVDPNLAFLFFAFGIAGVVFEVLHPGINVAGVVGIILLISSFVILGMLPVNVGGLVLIAAAIGFFVVDLKVPGHGLPTVAGIVSLVLGGLFLFNASVPNAQVSRPLIVGVALAVAATFTFVVRAALRARKAPPAMEHIAAGMIGVVEQDVAPVGIVRIGHESWSARARGKPIPAGAQVRVVEMQGLTVEVELVSEAGHGSRPQGTEVS